MKNEERPDDSGTPWNSEDVVFGGISCKQLSRLCTCFVSALRMANGEGKALGIRGQMHLVRTLIDQQLLLADSPNISPEDRQIIENNLGIGLQAVCLAGIFGVNQIDARHLVSVMVSTLKIAHKMSEETGPVGPDDEIIIQIRKMGEEEDGEHIEMGIRLESSLDMAEKMDDDIGREVKKIIPPPDLGPNEQGPN